MKSSKKTEKYPHKRWFKGAYILLLLLLAEIVIRFIPPQDRADFFFDGYTAAEIRNALRKSAADKSGGVKPDFFYTFASPPYRIDHFEKKSDKLRIACMGDSTTWGLHVEPQQAWCVLTAKKLEKLLKKPVEAFNFGYPGSTNNIAAETIIYDVLSVKPDLVLYSYAGLNDSCVLPIKESDYTRRHDPVRNTLRFFKLYQMLERLAYNVKLKANGGNRIAKVPLPEFKALAEKMFDQIEEAGATPILVTQWAAISDWPPIFKKDRFIEYRTALFDLAKKRDLAVVDIKSVFDEQPDKDFFVPNHIHYTPEGNALIAEKTARQIAQKLVNEPH